MGVAVVVTVVLGVDACVAVACAAAEDLSFSDVPRGDGCGSLWSHPEVVLGFFLHLVVFLQETSSVEP